MASLTPNSQGPKEAVLKVPTLTLQTGDHVDTIPMDAVISIVESDPLEEYNGSEKFYVIHWISPRTFKSGRAGYQFHSKRFAWVPELDLYLQWAYGPRRPRHLYIDIHIGIRRVHVIVSTKAGTGGAEDFFDGVVRPALYAYGFREGATGSYGFPVLDNLHEDDVLALAKTYARRLEASSKDDKIDCSHIYIVHYTDSTNSISDLAQQHFAPYAQAGVEQTVLLLSGDGGVIDFVDVMHHAARNAKKPERFMRPTIGLIPMGTGNASANSIGINNDATKGMRHFFNGTPQPLPVFRVNFSPGSQFVKTAVMKDGSTELVTYPPLEDPEENGMYGAVVCSWGLHASLVAESDTPEYRKHGAARFEMAAKELLAPSDGSAPHVYRGKVTMLGDGSGNSKPVALPSKKHAYVLVTMVSHLEENHMISPHSEPLDGQLRLVHFWPLPSEKIMMLLDKASQGGSHIDDDSVSYGTIGGLRIDFEEEEERWRRVCVDGTIMQVNKGGWMEVKKSEESFVNLVVMHQ